MSVMTFATKCPKCGNIVRQSVSFRPYNDGNFCGNCGLNVKEFSNYIRLLKTVGTKDDYCAE